MSLFLEGKIALITGGSRGIGRATALGFAEAGADVVVASRKLADLQEIADGIRGIGKKSLGIATHVGRLEDIKSLVTKTVEEFGRIDILVNNAATNPTTDSAIEIEERAWDAVMNLNLKGLFFLSQAVAKVMRASGGGCIINVASIAGIAPELPVYSISKAGVIMATKVMAKEWAKYNIRVNAVAPGLTRTSFTRYVLDNHRILEDRINGIPMRRPAEPEEMVGTMLYLASDASSYTTGAIISVDGGESI